MENVTLMHGIQMWSAPVTAWYYVDMCGASGGDGIMKIKGGKGARVNGTVHLEEGTELVVLVGQKGSTRNVFFVGSGGGGSFVVFASNDYHVPLSIAGGGGGGHLRDGGPGQAGVDEGLSRGAVSEGGLGLLDVPVGGIINDGGPGGGFISNGMCFEHPFCLAGGKAFLRLGLGGTSQFVGGDGGFGGGGACNTRAGAGGGYTGGSVYVNISAELTGGGGSFVPSNTWTTETGGCKRGDGYVTIRLLD